MVLRRMEREHLMLKIYFPLNFKKLPSSGLMKHRFIPSLATFSWVIEFAGHSVVLSLAMAPAWYSSNEIDALPQISSPARTFETSLELLGYLCVPVRGDTPVRCAFIAIRNDVWMLSAKMDCWCVSLGTAHTLTFFSQRDRTVLGLQGTLTPSSLIPSSWPPYRQFF